MGHLSGKDIYKQLHDRVDQQATRAPWSETFREILQELYSPEDAALIVTLPYGVSTLDQIARVTGRAQSDLHRHLDDLCERGLVFDLYVEGEYLYQVSPIVIGIFEFTMMRTDKGLDVEKVGRLFYDYLSDGALYRLNFSEGQEIPALRTLPHEGTIRESEYLEILDYEKATAIVESHYTFAVGLCSCRHEKHHAGHKECDLPLESCTSFGKAADYALRRGLAREWSKAEMLEHLSWSRENGLVLCADNVQGAWFMCHCCGCCCNAIAGISRFGYPNAVATSRPPLALSEVHGGRRQAQGRRAPRAALTGVDLGCGSRARPVIWSGPTSETASIRQKKGGRYEALCMHGLWLRSRGRRPPCQLPPVQSAGREVQGAGRRW